MSSGFTDTINTDHAQFMLKNASDELTLLAEALSSIEERERDVIILHLYSGMTLQEIAYRMDINEAQVSSIMSSGLRKVKAYL